MMGNFNILVGKLEGRDHLGDLGGDGRLILKWILNDNVVRMWAGFSWLKVEPSCRLL